MKNSLRFIALAVAEASGEVRDVGIIANRPEVVRSMMGIACEVIAPTMIPSKPGDRTKTDRRDAAKPVVILLPTELLHVSPEIALKILRPQTHRASQVHRDGAQLLARLVGKKQFKVHAAS